MPPPTTANVSGIGDFLKLVAGSIAPRRARGIRNGRRAVNFVQSGAVIANVSRQFESNASPLLPSTRLMRPAEAATRRSSVESPRPGVTRGSSKSRPRPSETRHSARGRRPSRRSQLSLGGHPRDRSMNRNVCSGRSAGMTPSAGRQRTEPLCCLHDALGRSSGCRVASKSPCTGDLLLPTAVGWDQGADPASNDADVSLIPSFVAPEPDARRGRSFPNASASASRASQTPSSAKTSIRRPARIRAELHLSLD